MKENITIPYTLCFCIQGGKVLMIYRNRPPNKDLWNGIGGKLELGEKPEVAVFREVKEEAEIDLHDAFKLQYGGVVYWEISKESFNSNRGIYTYVAYFKENTITWKKKEIGEGVIEWKNLDWLCDVNNTEVVDNMPQFLPHMLKSTEPHEYFCDYQNGVLKKVEIKKI
jgi:8-oxo-dGTP diphosphatase